LEKIHLQKTKFFDLCYKLVKFGGKLQINKTNAIEYINIFNNEIDLILFKIEKGLNDYSQKDQQKDPSANDILEKMIKPFISESKVDDIAEIIKSTGPLESETNVAPQIDTPVPSELPSTARKWWIAAAVAQQKNDLSFGQLKKKDDNRTETPFEVSKFKLEDGSYEYTMYLPNTEPPDEITSAAIGSIINLAMIAGYKLDGVADENQTSDCYAICRGLSTQLIGAYNALKRDEITILDSVPTSYRLGWDYAIFHCFNSKTKITDGLDLMHQRKPKKITPEGTHAWAKKGKIVYIDRLQDLIKTAARACANKLAEPITFFKKKDYVIQTIIGSPPMEGLLHKCEFEILKQDHENRKLRCGQYYERLTNDSITVDGLSAIYTDMTTIKKSDEHRRIAEAASARIPQLLVTTGKGQKSKNSIIKGQTLADKCKNINGGNNVRMIAKVMWSPETKITQDSFITIVIKQVNLIVAANKEGATEKTKQIRDNFDMECAKACKSYEVFATAVQCYLELIEDNEDNASWKATLGL
jgi:hypothetical protein